MSNDPLKTAREAVFSKTNNSPLLSGITIQGYDWKNGIDCDKILDSYIRCGFQASNYGQAVEEINKMLECRYRDFPEGKYIDSDDPFIGVKHNCTIFLGYTSNIVSSGLRETIKFLVEHNLVDCIVTTAGGVEEDLIKCMAPSILGDFDLDGCSLRDNAINRIGNILVPNANYCLFEDWVMPILNEVLKEQHMNGESWTPSKLIHRLGQKINNENSIYYWASKNNIPVFCPALTDGSLGDMLFVHSFKNPGLKLDIVEDLRMINLMAIKAVNTAMIIIGGGVIKHHICNANLMRNGADYAVFINTGSEFDGSDSGARPDEAKSWGKIKKDARPVKIYCEATLIVPLLVAQTFAKYVFKSS